MSFRTVQEASRCVVVALWLGAAPVVAQEPAADDAGSVVTPASDGTASVTARSSLPRASEADRVELRP